MAQPSEVVSYPVQHTSTPEVEVESRPMPQAPAAKVEAAPRPTPQVQAAEIVVTQPAPQIDLSSSGLTLIETDPNKAATIAPVAAESREHAPRRRQRQREVYTMENSEPLQQVETQSPN